MNKSYTMYFMFGKRTTNTKWFQFGGATTGVLIRIVLWRFVFAIVHINVEDLIAALAILVKEKKVKGEINDGG